MSTEAEHVAAETAPFPVVEGAACATGIDGCCIGESAGAASLTRGGRVARAALGLVFLGVAGALQGRSLPGRVRLDALAVVPAWFGISHLVAAQMGYVGCPELGAIPSVMVGRPIGTGCGPWERFDRRFGGRRG